MPLSDNITINLPANIDGDTVSALLAALVVHGWRTDLSLGTCGRGSKMRIVAVPREALLEQRAAKAAK